MNELSSDCKYVLEAYPNGWLLKSPQSYGLHTQHGVPIDTLSELMTLGVFPKDAVIDAGIASALGAVMAIGTDKQLSAWRLSITLEIAQKSLWSRDYKWIRGVDTGLSSMALLRKLTSCSSTKDELHRRLRSEENSIPQDSSDFGRCHGMLKFTERLGTDWHVRARGMSDRWDSILAQWEHLTKLYESDKHKDLHDALQ